MGGETPEAEDGALAEIELPDPLELPAAPPVASWISEPSRALALLGPYSPVPIDARAFAEQALLQLTEPTLAHELAEAINLSAPFANVALADGQEVIRLSLLSAGREALAARLAALEGEGAGVGEFGAVRLPPGGALGEQSSREWLAWIDEGDGGALVLANSLEGLATGRELAKAYGSTPVFFTVDPSSLPIAVEVPFSRVTGRGNLETLVVEAQAVDGQDPFADLPLATGTLGGLLAAPGIAAGASGRYADYADVVQQLAQEVNANVRQLPFLVRSVAEGLAAKFNTFTRTWDGRTLVAIGPGKHLRLAYGATNVGKSEVAAILFFQSVVDNLSLARNFTSQVPKISLRRRVAKADGEDIELLVIYEAYGMLPAELRGLVDGENRLNIAMAWPERAGGGMIVIGPDAVAQLSTWLEQTVSAPTHFDTAQQLLAASFAVTPESLQSLLSMPELELERLLSLDASGPKWSVDVAHRGGGLYVVELRTPGPPKPARAKR